MNTMLRLWLIFVLSINFCGYLKASPAVETVDARYLNSTALYKNNVLKISTGKIVRTWNWTGRGFTTTNLINCQTKKEWCNKSKTQMADWSIPYQPELPEAQLINITAKESDDEGFTTKHLEVIAEIFYPTLKTYVKYIIWAYPNSDGLRTQLWVKSDQKFKKVSIDNEGIPVSSLKVINVSSTASKEFKPEQLFDNNVKTIWKTSVSTSKPLVPNELVIDLQKEYNLNGLAITQWNDYDKFGWVEKFIVYTSKDTTNWGLPVSNGELSRADYPQYTSFSPNKARYVKLVIPATTKLNYSQWQTSMAELRIFSTDYPKQQIDQGRTDFFPINSTYLKRANIGYNADQQFRNSLEYDFLKEKLSQTALIGSESCNWSNILTFESNTEGVAFVKESHKTALQQGYLTGEFSYSQNGLEVTGWGIAPEELTNEYRKCWANWVIAYNGTEDERLLAIKQFDRLRFPTTLAGHKQIYGNSWGYGITPEAPWREKMNGGLESNVIKAIKAANEMGIESYLIDNGWTETPEASKEVFPLGHRPHPSHYTTGWDNVKNIAKENNVNLALWTNIGIKPEDLIWNQEQVGFVSWKWDYANFNSFSSFNTIETKARNFIKKSNHKVSLQWDLTESMPRYGLFWAREYGMVFLTNREPNLHILYTPSVSLRDAWDLSKYMNTNKFQITIRNVKNITPPSDAFLHAQEYATAIGLVGIPMFFEKLETYSVEDRQNIKNLLTKYKQERDALFDSYVFPIGDRPSNASFTGFQFVNNNNHSGHLLLFRELYSGEVEKEVRLAFLKNKTLKLFNLRNQTETIIKVNADGFAKFNIENPADFGFYRYEFKK